VHITYGVTNNGPGVASHGPWEVSRHARGGLIVWPGNDTPDASWDFQPDYQDGVYFLDDSLGATGKIFTDGSAGWIAYVTADVVMIKTWADVPAAMIAPNHSEVEVYLDPDNSYIEVEMHGAFAADLQVDASFSWDVDWYIRALPDDLDASSGSAALVAWIESVVH
jgi:hypothetical protein